MSRNLRILLILCLLLLLPAAALAEDISNFKEISLPARMTLPVYSAPSTDAWRGANGKAEASTNATIYAVGWDGDWLLMLYGTSGGASRAGYTPRSALKGREPDLPTLLFEYRDATISSICTLTDDPKHGRNSITTLFSGTEVTYLASFTDNSRNGDGVPKAYIEVQVDGKDCRGFIPMSSVTVSAQSTGSSLPSWSFSFPTIAPSATTRPGSSIRTPCLYCGGDGSVEQNCLYCSGGRVTCGTCGGRGRRTCGGCSGRGGSACRVCGGDGYKYNGKICTSCIGGRRTCSICYGTGTKHCTSCNGRGSEPCYICVGGKVTRSCGFCGGLGHQ